MVMPTEPQEIEEGVQQELEINSPETETIVSEIQEPTEDATVEAPEGTLSGDATVVTDVKPSEPAVPQQPVAQIDVQTQQAINKLLDKRLVRMNGNLMTLAICQNSLEIRRDGIYNRNKSSENRKRKLPICLVTSKDDRQRRYII